MTRAIIKDGRQRTPRWLRHSHPRVYHLLAEYLRLAVRFGLYDHTLDMKDFLKDLCCLIVVLGDISPDARGFVGMMLLAVLSAWLATIWLIIS